MISLAMACASVRYDGSPKTSASPVATLSELRSESKIAFPAPTFQVVSRRKRYRGHDRHGHDRKPGARRAHE